MTEMDWGGESARETKQDRGEGEKHGGIISDSVCGLGRNAEVWHTRMWSRSGLVSLSCPPLPQVHTMQLPAHISSLLSHRSPASLPASPSSHMEMFTEWYSWHTQDNFYGFSTLDAAAKQIQSLFLAGWRSWTLHSFQMKWLCRITLLRLTNIYTLPHQQGLPFVKWNVWSPQWKCIV